MATELGDPQLPVSPAEPARLDGEVCAVCDGRGKLRDAGRYQYTTDEDGARHGWPVVVCPEHR